MFCVAAVVSGLREHALTRSCTHTFMHGVVWCSALSASRTVGGNNIVLTESLQNTCH